MSHYNEVILRLPTAKNKQKSHTRKLLMSFLFYLEMYVTYAQNNIRMTYLAPKSTVKKHSFFFFLSCKLLLYSNELYSLLGYLLFGNTHHVSGWNASQNNWTYIYIYRQKSIFAHLDGLNTIFNFSDRKKMWGFDLRWYRKNSRVTTIWIYHRHVLYPYLPALSGGWNRFGGIPGRQLFYLLLLEIC